MGVVLKNCLLNFSPLNILSRLLTGAHTFHHFKNKPCGWVSFPWSLSCRIPINFQLGSLATFSNSGAKVLACKTVSGFRNNNQFPLASFAPLLQACANPALVSCKINLTCGCMLTKCWASPSSEWLSTTITSMFSSACAAMLFKHASSLFQER